MRYRGFLVVAALAIGVEALAAAPQPSYRIQKLELPGDFAGAQFFEPIALNNRGEVLAYITSPDTAETRIYLYRNGQALRLPGSEAFTYITATTLNNRGQVVGRLVNPFGSGLQPYVYDQGRFVDPAADLRPYRMATAHDLNALGWSTGAVDNRAYVYDSEHAHLIDVPGSKESAGIALNDRGAVVGSANFPIGGGAEETRLFIHDGNQTRFLQWPSNFQVLDVNDFNNAGQIAGNGVWDYSGHAGFIYADGRLTDVGNLGGGFGTYLQGLNEKGWAVGFSYAADIIDSPRAFLYRDGGIHNLNDLLRPADAARWTLTAATDVNDLGWITAYGNRSDGRSFMVLAAPVPEAAPWALLLAGLGLVGTAARRRPALRCE